MPFNPLAAPLSLDERRQGMVDNLRDAADGDFDGRDLDQQKMAHEETRTVLAGYAVHGDNPQLRSMGRALPIVERHLKAVGRIGVH
jgi:putative membrane protein